MKYDITIFNSAYREAKWPNYIDSIAKSCTKYAHEIIFCGPNPPSFSLPKHCFYIEDHGSPARCANIAVSSANGELVLLGADDALFFENSLDETIDFYYGLPDDGKKVVPIIYGEANDLMPPEYWFYYFHPDMRLGGIAPDTPMHLNFLTSREYWLKMGGYDCEYYATLNYGSHQIWLRMLADGVKYTPWLKHILMCEWTPSGDHTPIEIADRGDYLTFKGMFNTVYKGKIHIDINNWKDSPEIWQLGKLRNNK